MSTHQRTGLRSPIAWLFSALVWTGVACLAATQQWAELQGTPKQMTWLRAFAWQGVSWVLLIPASVLLFSVVRRHPIDRAHGRRLLVHALVSLLFGAVFLAIAVPVRLSMHPSPARWSFFGEAFYKSIPQFVTMGVFAYWGVLVVASLLETRLRLYGTLERLEYASPPGTALAQAPAPNEDGALTLLTPAGRARWRASEVLWAEPAPGGATVHTDHGAQLVRHTLTDLDEMLCGLGFVRVHRGVLVNVSRIREVTGSASRDGDLRLDDGTSLRLSRRRRAELDALLSPPTPGA